MRALFLSSAFLALFHLVGALEYDYQADIEIDVLFPRDETYNNLTGFPVVLAIQDIKAAYRFEWTIEWTVYATGSGAEDWDYFSGYASHSSPLLNDFQWHFDGVAIVPLLGYNFTRLREGMYRLEWEYLSTTCEYEDSDTIVYNIREVLASGEQRFRVVEDGSGLDFDIPLDECPLYGGLWSVEKSTSNYCPFLHNNGDYEEDSCRAQLKSQQQVECIREYLFEGTWEVPVNETEACRSSFERVDLEWYRSLYEIENPGGGVGPDDETEMVANFDDDDNEDQDVTPDASRGGQTPEDAGVSLRPQLLAVGLAGMAVLVV
ncbi:hypothetical protein BJX70DRAFT_380231 [Aspergillus crustosus]